MGSHRKTVVAAAVPIGFLLSGALVWQASYAAFSSTASNTANTWQAGSVTIDTGGASTLFSVSGLVPGSSGSRCITVNYTGDVAADVRLYSAAAGATDLAPYLDMTVAVGTADDASCTNWAQSSVLSTGGTAADLLATNTAYASGLTGWTPSAAESLVYRFDYQLQAATPDASQGDAAVITFTWESQNT